MAVLFFGIGFAIDRSGIVIIFNIIVVDVIVIFIGDNSIFARHQKFLATGNGFAVNHGPAEIAHFAETFAFHGNAAGLVQADFIGVFPFDFTGPGPGAFPDSFGNWGHVILIVKCGAGHK